MAVWQSAEGYRYLHHDCSVAVCSRMPRPTAPLQCGSDRETTAHCTSAGRRVCYSAGAYTAHAAMAALCATFFFWRTRLAA